MTDDIKITGMVLSSMPIGEYDRRIVLLTKERGRITAFAKGARRPNSVLVAASCPFVCGEFSLYEGRNSYTLKNVCAISYFESLQKDLNKLCYASYFTELADYFAMENLEASDLLNLVYYSFKALEKGVLKNELIRFITELKMLVLDGEYTLSPPLKVSESAVYAWQFIINQPVNKLFSFALADDALKELGEAVGILRRRVIDKDFNSLKVLNSLIE